MTTLHPTGTQPRSVRVLAISLFALALGEELWQVYVPAYLAALGASGVIVGLHGSLRDFLDAAYQVPGGWLSDRLGRRRALLLFTAIATGGYLVYAVAPSWPLVLIGAVGVMAWKAGAFPTTFGIIGDAVPRDRRAAAFAVQSVLVRLPRVISAPVGGVAIAAIGLVAGFRVLCGLTVAVGACVFILQRWALPEDRPAPVAERPPITPRRALAPPLRHLLVAECLVRIGEGIAASFIVLYVMQVQDVSVAEYGVLYAVQQAVAIGLYLPAGRLADVTGRRPLVALTFLFFASFPLAVRFAGGYAALVAAFVVGGLKEFGEPARKSLIVDLAPDDRRASTVGFYYAIRNFLVVPAGLIGGVLWQVSPQLPLEVAFAVSGAGLLVFLLTRVPSDR